MNRQQELDKLNSENFFDILIIGGGATGLGCAVDAASRGYKTVLLEKHDFSKGTSSRSTKLVHGGVRYLAQGNVHLVREALLERGRLLRNAPHVCHTMSFVLPVYKWWHRFYYGFGLWMYEFLSGRLSLGRTRLLSKQETLEHLPDLSEQNLCGGILYFDGQFDDSRLAVNIAQTAVNHGAVIVNHCSVYDFIKEGKKLTGVKARDEISGKEFTILAKIIINATGVFADSLLQLAENHAEQTISPSQGIHLVIEKHFFGGTSALMIPKTDDGRVIFTIPWHDKLIIGTTDTPVDQIEEEPKPHQEEINFLIRHFNRYTTSRISYSDIRSVYVGLRPLAKHGAATNTSVLPRDHVIKVLPSGLVHVTGGKWTTYRSMAEKTVDISVQSAGLPFYPSKTKNLRIHASPDSVQDGYLSVYGTDSSAIEKLIKDHNLLSEKVHPRYPYTKAEVKWFIENEMAITLDDIMARRLRLLFLDAEAAIEAAPGVATLLATCNGRSEEWRLHQIEQFNQLAKGYLCSTLSHF